MGMIQNDWLEPLKPEFRKPYYAELFRFVQNEYATRKIFPPADDKYNAKNLTQQPHVNVELHGHDHYPQHSHFMR